MRSGARMWFQAVPMEWCWLAIFVRFRSMHVLEVLPLYKGEEVVPVRRPVRKAGWDSTYQRGNN